MKRTLKVLGAVCVLALAGCTKSGGIMPSDPRPPQGTGGSGGGGNPAR
ncbi:MAG TPA: hypothetical protein VD963_08905 [Phycisphaerales bacterium]|nr:hypothetical protein [Phycisphaerales bacterium]